MMPPNVLFVDNHLLALHKRSGLLCQPNDTSDPSLEAEGKSWVKSYFKKPGNVFLHAVHRLDRPVSGVVLFARTDKALSRLNASMREDHFKKLYWALIEGNIQENAGVLEHDLVKEEYHARLATAHDKGSKKCLLKYKTLNSISHFSLIEVELLTGRYHQIRAQLAASGYPIVGDHKYGSKVASKTLFLHHIALEFPHPIKEGKILIESPPPSTWKKWINNQ